MQRHRPATRFWLESVRPEARRPILVFTALPGVQMTKAGPGLQAVLVVGMVVALGPLTGCSDASASGSSAVSTGSGVTPIDRTPTSTPTVAGVPSTTAVAGQPYSFQPK